MAKTVKKVDVKKATKGVVSAKIAEVFKAQGIEVSDGQEYGFTEGTLVLHMEKCDVQVKLITPKTGLERYEVLEVEEEAAE